MTGRVPSGWYVDTDGLSITVRGTVATEEEARKMVRAIEVNIPLLALATEAGTAETENTGSVHEGAGLKGNAQPSGGHGHG